MVRLHLSGPVGGACPDSFRAARSGRVRQAVRARRWLLCGRETRVVRRAASAERPSAAERRPNKTLGPWGTGRTETATDVETKVLTGGQTFVVVRNIQLG